MVESAQEKSPEPPPSQPPEASFDDMMAQFKQQMLQQRRELEEKQRREVEEGRRRDNQGAAVSVAPPKPSVCHVCELVRCLPFALLGPIRDTLFPFFPCCTAPWIATLADSGRK